MTSTPLVVVETRNGTFVYASVENLEHGLSREFEDQSTFERFLKENLSGRQALWQEWRNESLVIDKVTRISA